VSEKVYIDGTLHLKLIYRLELQHKELSTHLSKLSSTHTSIQELEKNVETRGKRLDNVNDTQRELEDRANRLLRLLVTMNAPQTSEAEDKWFKELMRVKTRIDGQRGLVTEVKTRMGEGRKFIELAGRQGVKEEESGKRKLDGRVMEAIEEAYDPGVRLLTIARGKLTS
jgi:hypothetical protein